jgi:hypothetical protein
MALTKVCGIETEYGIMVRGADNNPVSASSLLINAYVAATTSRQRGRVGWDFDDEHPANDARGCGLGRTAQRDVGLARTKVANRSARIQLDQYLRVQFTQVAKHRRQHGVGEYFLGRQPYGAAQVARL